MRSPLRDILTHARGSSGAPARLQHPPRNVWLHTVPPDRPFVEDNPMLIYRGIRADGVASVAPDGTPPVERQLAKRESAAA